MEIIVSLRRQKRWQRISRKSESKVAKTDGRKEHAVQKTSGKALAEKYKNFQNPVLKVFTEGKELKLGDGMYLGSAEVVSSVKKEPDMAVLTYLVERIFSESIGQFEKVLALGQKMEVKAGYGTAVSRIFLGYLHEISVSDAGAGYLEYTLICLDVKGLMKKNSAFLASGAKKAQQVLDELLKTKNYSELLERKSVTPIPANLNQECVVGGETDYDWLCDLAKRLDYEFFCGRGEFVFRKAGQAGGEALELTGEYGLLHVKLVVSMEGQTGGVQVAAHNRQDEKLSGSAQWQGESVPFGGKLKQKLKGFSLSLWDMGAETGEQAKLAAQNRMARSVRKCARMEAQNLGLPELVPGICIKITDDAAKSLCGSIYIEEAEHCLDERGYRTIVRGYRV